MAAGASEDNRFDFVVLVRGGVSTANWLSGLLRDKGLVVESTPVRRETHFLLLIRLPLQLIPEAAQQAKLFKLHKDGQEKPFVLSRWPEFTSDSSATSPEQIFTRSERQAVVQHMVLEIRATEPTEVVGQPTMVLKGQSVFAACQRNHVIRAMFPPHDYEKLAEIRKSWIQNMALPVFLIRSYFGLRIAFYFAFLSFYTWSLLVPMVVGILLSIHKTLAWRVGAVLFSLMWNTLIVELWKRRGHWLSCHWGLHEQMPPRTRLLYVDQGGPGPLAQRVWKLIASQIVVTCCVTFSIVQQYQYFLLEAYVAQTFPVGPRLHTFIRLVPGILNALVSIVASDVYRSLTRKLTGWENHRTLSEYVRHFTVKLIVFDFFARFGTLFYTAFYLQNIPLLRKQVYIQLILSFTKDNFIEVAMPKAVRRTTMLLRSLVRRESDYLPGIHSILSEAEMPVYGTTYTDYYKMFSQFAFVFLFGAVVPLAPLLAFMGNMVEMMVVGYKLIAVFQRPLQVGSEGIGIWEPAFRAIGFLAVPTNIALLCVEHQDSVSALSRLFSDTEFVLFLVLIEHMLLFFKFVLQYTLRTENDCPHLLPP
ncbi:anoctamin-10-like [Ornithodoros turicata]|uniref:anoctamin-10-like n=1 Tax=Ornithodoros turicata TaxID=34597 RepID=UPI0031386C84